MAYQEVFKRVEMKYVLPPDRMSAVREAMEGRMALDRYGLSEIRNLYCDTPSWILARRSIEKPVYKEKVRVRSYGPASGEDTVFLELKKKYDGIVYKRRMALPCTEAMDWVAGGHAPDMHSQIKDELEYTIGRYGNLRPMMYLAYRREAYASTDGDGFRLTLDTDITARLDGMDLSGPPSGTRLLPEGYTLMELKIKGAIPMWLVDAMNASGIHKESFSKYGNAYKALVMGHPYIPRTEEA